MTLRSLVTGLRLSALSLALLLCAATARGDDFPVGNAGGSLAGSYPNPTLAVVNSNVGTFGDASHVPQFTVTAGGQITAASGLSISIANANLVAGAYSNITGVGALASGSLAAGFTLVPVTIGGTGLATWTAHAIPIGEGTSVPNFAAPGISGTVLVSGGVSSDPAFGTLTNSSLATGSFTNITGVGTLTAGSLGTGFTLNLSLPTYSGTLPAANVAPSATNGWVLTTTGGVTGWAPNAASTITWANDLAGSTNSSQTVVSISGATPINITPNNLQWVAAATGPTIAQVALASTGIANGTAGVPTGLTAQAGQAATGGTFNGGAGGVFNISSGAGGTSTGGTAGVAGLLNLKTGGVTQLSLSPAANTTIIGNPAAGTSQPTLTIQNATGNSYPALALKDATGTTYQYFGYYGPNSEVQFNTINSLPFNVYTSNVLRMSLGSAGNITMRTPLLLADATTTWETLTPAAAFVDQYAAGVTSANINFAADATASGTAAPLLIGAQNETGTGVTVGGALTLYTGSGTGNGIMHIKHGGSAGTDSLTLSQTGFAAFPAYGTGLAHFDSGGNITSSGVINADLTAGSFTSITGVGALAAGSLATGFTVVTAPLGGTGVASPTAHGTLVAEGASPATPIAPGAAGLYFRSNGASADPSFQAGPTWTTKTYCASGCTGTSGATFICPTPGNMTVCGTAGGGGGGGGGNGGSAVANNAAGGGAGGGGSLYSCQQVVCTPGGTETATYGAGGTGGGVAQSGNPGGPTYLIDSVLGVIAEWRGASGGSGGPTVIPSTGASDLCSAAGGGNVTINGGNSLAMCAASPIPAMSPGQGGAGGLAGNAPSIGSFTIALGQPGADSAFIPLSSIFGFTGGFGGAAGATSGLASGTYDGGSSGGGGGGGALGGNGGVGGVGGNGGAVTGNAGGACGATPAGIGSGGGGGGGAGSGGTSGGSGASGCAGTAGALLATWPN